MAYSINAKDYFNTKLYTGNATARTISGIGFQPDWVWGKSRTNTENNSLFDAVRGAGYDIKSDATNAQSSNTGITAFNSDGYVLGTADSLNSNSQNFVTWNWKANGSGSANSDGTISSTVSVNTTSGFSIVSYTGNATSGATIGHGLGVAPAVVLVKRLNATSDWVMYHKGMGASKFIVLNTTAAEASSGGIFYNTAPTASLFYVGDDGATNASGGTYVAYCFAEKTGFSKFGSYTGNGNADGPFIYTGFKPAWYLWKPYNATDSWNLVDSKRDGYNPDNNRLFPNSNSAEDTQDRVDLVSNGIKIKTSDGGTNSSSRSYIYMAFGQPIVSTNGDIATAR